MTDRRTGVLFGLGVIAVILWLMWPQDPPPPQASAEELVKRARQFQQEEQWCEAEKAWGQVLGSLGTDQGKNADEESWRQEALKERLAARSKCQPGSPPVPEKEIPELPPNKRPKPVPEDKIAEFYTNGKTIKCVAAFSHITGTGTNTEWTFKRDAYFAYEYRAPSKLKLLRTKERRLSLSSHFRKSCSCAPKPQRDRTAHAESPILPSYGVGLMRRCCVALLLLWQADCGGDQHCGSALRRTLTTLKDWLKSLGHDVTPNDDIVINVRPDQLTGLRFEIRYVSGLGVTHIKVLDGKRLDPDRLVQLAYHSSLFMDYFLAEGASKP